MIARRIAIILLMLSLPSIVCAQQLAPLASGGAPPCPEHNGIREFHSAVARDSGVSAFIVGLARRDTSGCRRTAQIQIEQPPRVKTIALPEAEQQDFAIIDFSPDGSKIFFTADAHQKYPNEQFRYLQVAVVQIPSGEIRRQNAWDLMGWKDCDESVEPDGFTADGKLAMWVRPAVMSPPRRTNCVPDAHLYALGEQPGAAEQVSDAASIKRYGRVVSLASQGCRSDPDVAGACFTVHGGISTWNGAPTFRIAPAGTKRMLGVTERPLPASMPSVLPSPLAENLNFDVEAIGDFVVCPFTVEKPGHMQMVCVESARNLSFKRR